MGGQLQSSGKRKGAKSAPGCKESEGRTKRLPTQRRRGKSGLRTGEDQQTTTTTIRKYSNAQLASLIRLSHFSLLVSVTIECATCWLSMGEIGDEGRGVGGGEGRDATADCSTGG